MFRLGSKAGWTESFSDSSQEETSVIPQLYTEYGVRGILVHQNCLPILTGAAFYSAPQHGTQDLAVTLVCSPALSANAPSCSHC